MDENKFPPNLEYDDWIRVETIGNIPVIRIIMEANIDYRYADVRTNFGYVSKKNIIEVRGINGKYWKRDEK